VQIFGLADTIPFHLRLCAPLPSLRAFFPRAAAAASPVMRVYLLRRIAIEVRGQRAWRDCILGEGGMRPVPPSATPDPPGHDSLEMLDWQGQVRCTEGVDAGSFHAGRVIVKVWVFCSNPFHISSLHPVRISSHWR
jgi:hypothetical protein